MSEVKTNKQTRIIIVEKYIMKGDRFEESKANMPEGTAKLLAR